MASIRLTCPMCGKLLEVGAEHAGQEVECGECLQVFVAEVPRPSKIKAVTNDLPPGVSGRPRPRRDDYDDDDDYEYDRRRDEYDDDDYEPAGTLVSRGAGGAGGAALVVGVLALLTSCCPLTGVAFGITAMLLGSSAKRYAGPSGAATAATVLGSLACLISLSFVAWLIAFGLRGGGN